MADGRLEFDTKIDNTGVKEGVSEIKKTATQALSGVGDSTKGLATVFQSTGAKLTTFITKPALAAAGALAGLTLAKGFTRLKNIDTAKAQLEGLGHSADEVNTIMDSAMESVKGTAYGFDEAATAAASAVAAGIAPGKELTRYLGLVGDAASQSRLSFTDMGSIFNKVMASGKISMEEVNQLADQGIPIYEMLSEQLGVTQSDVSEMVSAGKVDSETFLNAIETNIGGAAKMMGEKSFVGAISNIGASLGRIGANFLDAGGKGGGFFSQLKPLAVDLMDVMEGLEDRAADWGVTFGNAFAKVINFIKGVPPSILGIGTALTVSAGPLLKLSGGILKNAAAIKTFKTEQQSMGLMAGIANGHLTVQQAAFIKISGAIKTAASSIKTFVTSLIKKATAITADTAATTINTTATKLNGAAASNAAKKVLAFASAHKVALIASLGLAAPIIALAAYMLKTGASADEVANNITMFANKLALMITEFANQLPGMINQILPAITQVVQAIVVAIPALIPILIQAGIQLFMALVNSITQIIGPLVATLPQIITAIVGVLPTLIPALIQAGIQLFMALVQAIPQIVPVLVAALPQIINAIVGAIPSLIPALIQAGITLFMALVQAIPQVIVALIAALPQIIKAIVTGLKAGFGQIKTVGIDLLKRLWNGISSWAGSLKNNIVNLAKSLPGKVKSGLGSLVSAGRDWIKGLWNGIGNAKDWLISKIKGLCKSAKDAILDFFGINSPSRVMAEIGSFITQGLGVGIESKTKELIATVRQQSADVRSAYSQMMEQPITASLRSRFVSAFGAEPAATPVGTTVYQEVNINQPVRSPIETARALKLQATFGLAGTGV